MDESKGIIVLGVPRSGTTLVRRILDAHPNIASPGETCIFSACARFLHSETVSDGLEFGVLNGLAFAGFDRSETLDRLRQFAVNFNREYARKQGKSRWAEKTAVDIFHLDKIEELCMDHVQYLCVVRHGLDVACSIQEFSNRGYTYLSEIHEYIKHYARPLEAFAHAWVDANQSMHEFLQRRSQSTLLIRYEDLIAAPPETLESIFDFLDEDYSNEIIQHTFTKLHPTGLSDWKTYQTSSIHQESLGRWKSLPANVVSRLADICNPTLESFGYGPVAINNPDDQATARRKYEFSLQYGANKLFKNST